ncbi:MAG: hypothetical protein IJ659_09545 [Alloprevotella sp.]|nr:hypothetical protein [Alloprevotella sp.]MBR1594998.1 hypothetical protein [Alloprevotella sp.]
MNSTKNILPLLLLLLGLVLGLSPSCSRQAGTARELEEIRTVGEKDPVAAAKMLDSLSSADAEADEEVVMRRELLQLRLQGKGICVQTSDVAARQVYDYFMAKGSRGERLEACLCLAGVYRDLHDSPKAIRYYNEVLDMASAGTGSGADSLALTEACMELSALYGLQYNYKLALETAERGLETARRQGRVTPRLLAAVAAAARGMNDAYTVLRHQREALDMIQRDGTLDTDADVVADILADASEYSFTEEAERCRTLLESISPKRRPRGYMRALATYYRCHAKADSAISCYQRIYATSRSAEERCEASRHLALLYERKGDGAQSQKYALAFIHAERDYRKTLQHEQAVSAYNEFVYNRNAAAEERAYRAAAEAQRSKMEWIAAFAFLLVLSLLLILTQRYRNLRRRNAALERMREMEGEIRHGQDVERQLQAKEKLLAEKLDQNERLFRYAFTENLQASAGDVLRQFRMASGGRHHLSSEEWKQMFAAVDTLYPGFRAAVVSKVGKPTEDKLRIAYLLKAGMGKPQIASLTGYPTTTVWRKVRQLTEVLKEELWRLDDLAT